MKILIIGRIDKQSGGPRSVIINLKKTLENNNKVKIFDFNSFSFFSDPINFEDYDLVYIHELWSLKIIKYIKILEKLSIPFFFVFHGVLNRWSLKKNNFVKKIFIFLFKKNFVNACSAFHFLNNDEFNDAQKILGKTIIKKSFVIPNGIFIEKKMIKKKINDGILKLVFFGRFHPKKGLNLLIESFELIKRNQKNIHLDLIGPDNEYKKIIKKLIIQKGLNFHIRFKPPIFNQSLRNKVLSKYDFFILPSYDEADSVAIKESLSIGLPVILSKECKIEDVEKKKIGFLIELNSKLIYKKLLQIQLTKSNYKYYVRNSYNYAKKNFEIAKISKRLNDIMFEIRSGVKYSKDWI